MAHWKSQEQHPRYYMPNKRLAILISGRGSNMLAVADAVKQGAIDAEICLVLSNKQAAAGLTSAKDQGLPTHVLEKTEALSRAEYDQQLLQAITAAKPDLIVLAGFMYILGKQLIDAYPNKIINIHPSLLPKYPGLHTHRKVIANGDKQHGLTIHYVTAELDAGPIIMQKQIDVMDSDDEESLAARLLPYEHECLVKAVASLTK